MREIKFRAWDKKRKKMWYPEDMQHGHMVDHKNCGDLMSHDIEQLAIGADGTIYILDECGNYEYAENVGESYKPMFYIGIKDKNNRKIYEGDIVKWKWIGIADETIEPIGFVYFNQDYARFCVGWLLRVNDYLEGKRPGTILNFIDGCINDKYELLEVVGNIYENPELLKEVENA